MTSSGKSRVRVNYYDRTYSIGVVELSKADLDDAITDVAGAWLWLTFTDGRLVLANRSRIVSIDIEEAI
jgi:hypothetical protein